MPFPPISKMPLSMHPIIKRYIKLYKNCKGMARLFFPLLAAVLALFLLSACAKEPKSIINNPDILEELDKVTLISMKEVEYDIPLTRSDLSALNESVSFDPLASHYVEELYWMVDHNETEHLGHTIDFLATYLKSGKKGYCTPHELWHATIYARHADWALVDHAKKDATESFPYWVAMNQERQEKFPQFYLRLDDQIVQVDRLIKELNRKNYSDELMQEIDVLSDTALC
jgi:hypothetical protein